MNPRYIGIIDGIFFLVLWAIIGFLNSPQWQSVLEPMLYILAPYTLLVVWRGNKMTTIMSRQETTVLHFAKDGFKWGFLSSVTIMIWSISSQVYAAGNHLDGANLFSMQVGQYILTYALPITILGGVLGAMHGTFYYYLNRWLYTANKSSNSDAVNSAGS